MLILGGVGRLYGAFVGPVVYMVLQDFLSQALSETGTSASASCWSSSCCSRAAASSAWSTNDAALANGAKPSP